MSGKLFIDLWGLTVNAEGVHAITGAVVVLLVLLHRRLR
jgi:hypothetical protein